MPIVTTGAGGGSLIIVSPITSSDCGPGPFELNACTITTYFVPLLRSVILTSSIFDAAYDRSLLPSRELPDDEGACEFALEVIIDDEDEVAEGELAGESESTVIVLKI